MRQGGLSSPKQLQHSRRDRRVNEQTNTDMGRSGSGGGQQCRTFSAAKRDGYEAEVRAMLHKRRLSPAAANPL